MANSTIESLGEEQTPELVRRRMHTYIADSRQHTIARQVRERAQLHQDFFRGGTHQWTEDEWNAYKSKGVTPVTVNRCKPVAKALMGMQLQNRQEVSVLPRRNGSAVVAQVHRELLKHTQDVSYADYVYAQVLLRGGIDTESYLKYEIDRGMNPNGQPLIRGLSTWQVDVDRNGTEYDLNESAEYVIERKWMRQAEMHAMWPGAKEEINLATGRGVNITDAEDANPTERLATFMSGDGMLADDDAESDTQIPDTDLLRKYRFLLKKVYWKEIKARLIVQDTQEGGKGTRIIDDQKTVEKLSRKAKKSVRFKLFNVSRKILHETVMLGEQLLEDIEEPLGPNVTHYPIARYSPIWDEGYPMGWLDDCVPLNKEENIHRTQTIRLLNQTANSGWIVGSADNKRALAMLKNFGAVPGVVVDRSKFGNFIQKIEPNQLSQHFVMGQQFELDVKRVSGVDDATQGYQTSGSESGRAIGLKAQSNRLSNELYFDNFYRTLEIFGTLMMEAQLNNDFYTDEEIKSIISESSLLDMKLMSQARFRLTSQQGGVDLPPPQVLPPIDPNMFAIIKDEDKGDVMERMRDGAEGAELYNQNYPQLNQTWEDIIKVEATNMLLKQLRDDKGMYGIKVTISPSAPTERMAQFLQMDALLSKYGQLIPPDVFIDLLDMPEAQREKIKSRLLQAPTDGSLGGQPGQAGQQFGQQVAA